VAAVSPLRGMAGRKRTDRAETLSLAENARSPQQPVSAWARLIPGEIQDRVRGRKKPAGSVGPFPFENAERDQNTNAEPQGIASALLLPAPLQGRAAKRWMKSILADWALITLNWLALGALLIPLRVLVPRISWSEFLTGAPLSLLGFAVLHAAFITLVGHSEKLYEPTKNLRAQARVLAKSVALATLILCFELLFQSGSWVKEALCCAVGVLNFGALWTWRHGFPLQRGAESLAAGRNVLIAGTARAGQWVASCIEQHPEGGRKVCGFLDDSKKANALSDLARMARTGFIDELILAGPRNPELALQMLNEAQRLKLDVEIVPELFGCRQVGEVERVGDAPMICLHAERLPLFDLLLKRAVDITGAGLSLLALSPLLAAIAILIKLHSRGPVLYSAPRAGRKGRVFRCFKFRTMVSNADALKAQLQRKNFRSGPIFKITGDPRITKVGRWLRRYSLDELPQLWNVVRGEMSLVGPRPHPVAEFEAYELEHFGRLDVTPGMTGLWQVTARRDPSFEKSVELDREYIRSWNLGLDFRILLKTVAAVARGSGD